MACKICGGYCGQCGSPCGKEINPMGYDEFGPAYPEPDEDVPARRPLRSRIIDIIMLWVIIAGALWLLGDGARGAEAPTLWVPRAIVMDKDNAVTLWGNRAAVFDNEQDCKNFLAMTADRLKTMIDEYYGDKLDHYETKCIMVLPERDI